LLPDKFKREITNQRFAIILQFASFNGKLQTEEVLFLINRNEATGDGRRVTGVIYLTLEACFLMPVA
jgi:hypothetical protein